MRVVIAGAGKVGRSVAKELLASGHEVLIIDREPTALRTTNLPQAQWLLADTCEVSSLEEAKLSTCQVMVAATGDDKTNLVASLLAKTEFGVGRTVARVNDPANEWMFDDMWGVDVCVSTPRIMTALVEEAVTVGDIVPMFTFQGSGVQMIEFTIPHESPYIGTDLADAQWPHEASLLVIVRQGIPHAPTPTTALEEGDELMFLVTDVALPDLRDVLGAG